MSNAQLGLAFGRLVRLEQNAVAIAAEVSPKLAARGLGFAKLLHDAFETMRAVPGGTPGLLVAQDLWLALERCSICLSSHDPKHPRDVTELREALDDARRLADVVRVIVAGGPLP